MPTLLRQSIYSRLAGYEDVNDAVRLSIDPVMRAITGKNDKGKQVASANTIGRFETCIILPLCLQIGRVKDEGRLPIG